MEPIPLGRQAWSLVHQAKTMALGPGTRQAADEEARAELDLLNSRLEKTTQLNKKLQASISRLEASGRTLQEAIGPIYGDTQRLQVFGTSMCNQSRRLWNIY
jgi:exocyst complex protein 7